MEAKKRIPVNLIALLLILATCILVMPFVSQAAEQKTYTLTDTLTEGHHYLIVSANESGDAYALKNDGGSVSQADVSIAKQLTIQTDSTDIVWTAVKDGEDIKLSNTIGETTYYLSKRSGSLKISDSGNGWTYSMDDKELTTKGSSSIYRLFYSSDSSAFKLSTSSNNIYIFDADISPISVTGVTLSPETLSIFDGEVSQLTATVAPENATNKNVTWSSTNEETAIVDENGIVTGVKDGTATITVTTADGSYQDTCTVTVSAFSGDTINMTPDSSSDSWESCKIEVGETVRVNITNGSSSNDYDFAAELSKTGVATVTPATQNIAAGDTKSYSIIRETHFILVV